MDFKNMTDSELASVMVDYINRVADLLDLISKYLNNTDKSCIQVDEIKKMYKQLKNELHGDAHYLGLISNRNRNELYMGAFMPSIREAEAFGFTVPTNHRVDQSMFFTVEEAHYKLTKYHTLEEWRLLI